MRNTHFLRLCTILLVIAVCISLTACGKEKSEPVEPEKTPEKAAVEPPASELPSSQPTPSATPEPSPEPVKLSILYNNGPVTSLELMTTAVLQLVGTASDGSTGGTWTSGDASVASVDENGVVTCWKVGSAKITYTLGETAASCTLNITEPKVKICFGGLEKSDISLSSAYGGYEIQLQSVVTNVKDGSAEVTWSSDDEAIAKVSENGYVKALKEGVTTVHCKCGTAKASCIIRVVGKPPEEINKSEELDPTDTKPRVIITFAGVANSDFTTYVGTSVDMNYKLVNIDQNAAVTWSVEDTSVATVNADGVVTGVKKGTTNLVCTCGDVNCKTIIRIVDNP